MTDIQIPEDLCRQVWEKYHSDINIEITHCLTEPVCPFAVTVIEHPRKVLEDTGCFADTIAEAVEKSYQLFIEKHLNEK